ncbi:hypothetical protein [Laribacter hongkongensis]|uniref:hypothetical protein n=1 Tax=Laribacter hongkongensis TaxID=168471 RepID=UPI001EFDD368|nr:hypothetical protein [Laribacter hongkongensis]MCG9082360.1 hypothetical protein [Laribacter hongkongensis]MCG9096948.1 hypothetical protein [Laribacter hongkongensis]
MSVKYLLTALAVLANILLANTVWADEATEDWFNIAESSSYRWQGKIKSGSLTSINNKKNNGYVYVYQVENKQTKRYEYGKVAVFLEACRKGYGYVYYNNMRDEYTGKDAFVRFGPTIADKLGTTSCLSWDNDTGKVSGQDNGNGWELAAEASQSGSKYFLKRDTVRNRNYNGKPAIAAVHGKNDVRADTTSYSEYIIATSDCKKGFGTIYQLDFDGTLRDKSDVALNGDSVISGIASTLCGKL